MHNQKAVSLSTNDLNLSGKLRELLDPELASAELASERIKILRAAKRTRTNSSLKIEVVAIHRPSFEPEV